jgi:hypothetical protein
MKHTLREILAHFAFHVQHTHEAAVEATYNLGYETAVAATRAEFAAGLGNPEPTLVISPPTAGAASDDDEEKDLETAQAETIDQDPQQTGKAAAAEARPRR